MGWYILLGFSCLLMLVFVPKSEWKRLSPAGLISVLVLVPIEVVFTSLGGFSYVPSIINLHKVPMIYLLSSFPAGVFVAYYYPAENRLRLLYVLFISLILLLIEMIMIRTGYMKHINWGILRSFFLNLYGFIVMLWLCELIGAVGKKLSYYD